MVAYDVRARNTAVRMLKPKSQGGKGQEVTVEIVSGGTFDPATDTTTGETTTTETGSGVEEAYSAQSIDGTTILSGDVKFLLSPLKTDGTALTAPVADRSTLTKDDGAWIVKKVDRIAPAGTVVMYILQLRKG